MHPMLNIAIQAARQASRIILRFMDQLDKVEVSQKDQNDFVTQVDKMSEKIIKSGANVVICQKGIDDLAQYYLAKAGIFACRRIPREDMEKLANLNS